jgi:probable F420-dependent oxidoreductase
MQHPATHPLKVGIFLPFVEYMMDGRTPRWTDILAMAQEAENLGFDSLWLGEHLIFHFPEPHPWSGHAEGGPWECWSLLAALAAATKRIEIGPLVGCTSFHNPALLAKMADTIDEISGGRFILGLGAGWNEDEYRAFGFPFDHRASRFEEAITIIHALLHEGRVDFAGAYYQARECELRPRGPRPNGPPILIGTTGPRMLRLAARYADLWNVDLWGYHQPDEIGPLRTMVDEACAAVGRDPATLGRTVALNINPTGRTDIPETEAIRGSAEELVGILRAFAQEGISHIQVCLLPNSLASLEAFAPTLELLRSS